MATSAVRRISTVALGVALYTTFMAVLLLLNPMAEDVAPAAEIQGSWGGYGELPPVW